MHTKTKAQTLAVAFAVPSSACCRATPMNTWMTRRRIRLVAAGFFTMTNLGIIPPTGSAMGLAGWRFGLAAAANFILGALMCVGVGNYAPSMALLAFLGMHPIAAYPIMIASDVVLIPVASLGFLRSGRFAPAVAVGLTLGGIVGSIAAFPLVKMLGNHLTLMRWVVTGVITYAAIAMLRSVLASQRDASLPTMPE